VAGEIASQFPPQIIDAIAVKALPVGALKTARLIDAGGVGGTDLIVKR
jgi:hypothetical protein